MKSLPLWRRQNQSKIFPCTGSPCPSGECNLRSRNLKMHSPERQIFHVSHLYPQARLHEHCHALPKNTRRRGKKASTYARSSCVNPGSLASRVCGDSREGSEESGLTFFLQTYPAGHHGQAQAAMCIHGDTYVHVHRSALYNRSTRPCLKVEI